MGLRIEINEVFFFEAIFQLEEEIMAKKELCDLIIAAYLEKHASKSIVTSFKKHANINEDNLDKYDKFLDILECTTKMAQLIAPANDQDKDQDDKIDVMETNGKNEKSSSNSDTTDEDENKKKRKLSNDTKSPAVLKKKKENGTTPKNSPFRRVESDKIEITNAALRDNSYKSFDTYGAKASKDLIVTQGKSFRHEKTKKKRGSYRGGEINMGVNSVKFDSD